MYPDVQPSAYVFWLPRKTCVNTQGCSPPRPVVQAKTLSETDKIMFSLSPEIQERGLPHTVSGVSYGAEPEKPWFRGSTLIWGD